jgi:hypothetical protein
MDEVLMSVDPHEASSTLAVFDPTTRTVIDGARLRTPKTATAVRGSLAEAPLGGGGLPRGGPFPGPAARGRRRTGGRRARQAGGSSAGVLPGPRQEDRPRRRRVDRTRRPGRRRAPGGRPQRRPVTPRLLSDRREEFVALRTQAICRLHRLLAELTLGGVRRELTAPKAAASLARLRPRDEPGRIRRQLAMDHLSDVRRGE